MKEYSLLNKERPEPYKPQKTNNQRIPVAKKKDVRPEPQQGELMPEQHPMPAAHIQHAQETLQQRQNAREEARKAREEETRKALEEQKTKAEAEQVLKVLHTAMNKHAAENPKREGVLSYFYSLSSYPEWLDERELISSVLAHCESVRTNPNTGIDDLKKIPMIAYGVIHYVAQAMQKYKHHATDPLYKTLTPLLANQDKLHALTAFQDYLPVAAEALKLSSLRLSPILTAIDKSLHELRRENTPVVAMQM